MARQIVVKRKGVLERMGPERNRTPCQGMASISLPYQVGHILHQFHVHIGNMARIEIEVANRADHLAIAIEQGNPDLV